jgi:hypothetical protein
MTDINTRRVTFEKRCKGIHVNSKATVNRVTCPCCGYPTLKRKARHDICELCNWEDDGEDDLGEGGSTVPGGANGSYTLALARKNFIRYRTMYSPNNNTTVTGPDSEEREALKSELTEKFDQLLMANGELTKILWQQILAIELALFKELKQSLRRVNQPL